jgi:hypothetical protein
MMRISSVANVLLATVACLACGDAGAEPRGPSAVRKTPAKESVEATKNDNASPDDQQRGVAAMMMRRAELLLQRDRELAEKFDAATHAAKLAELKIWIRRIPGRFRIEGRIERMGGGGLVGAKVSGVADCDGVGQGGGVRCIFNAMWPLIDAVSRPAGKAAGPIQSPSPSEALRSFRPAVLVLGVDPQVSELRALMVTDDSLAHTWGGRLTANTVKANRLTGCRNIPPPDPQDNRCFQPLELIAEPGREIVTIAMQSVGVTLKLVMQRDPEARPVKPMKVR